MQLYRHLKTQGVYVVLFDNAILEANDTPCVVYQGIDTDRVWIRPSAEFHDGRFVKLRPSEAEKT